MPKKINHETRKKEILNEALELFSQQGYEATTLADVAKAAKIARTTLYQYFRNKHQILFFASKQFTDKFMIYYYKVVTLEHLRALDRLRFILSHIVISCSEKRRELVSQSAFILNLEKEGHSIGNLVHKRTRPLKSLLAALLNQINPDHKNSEHTINLLLALVTSGIVHVLLFPTENCDPILEHIATALNLLFGNRDDVAYAKVHQNLLQLVEQESKQNQAQNFQDDANHKESKFDDEWDNFLDPFRSLE